MGWCSGAEWSTRKDLVTYLRNSRNTDNLELVRSCVKGNRLWSLFYVKDQDSYLINLDLLQGGFGTRDNPSWGYKDIHETGLFQSYDDCPISYFNYNFKPEWINEKWRESVKAKHALKNKVKAFKLEAGLEIQFGGKPYKLVRPHSYMKNQWVAVGADGREYRFSKENLNRSIAAKLSTMSSEQVG